MPVPFVRKELNEEIVLPKPFLRCFLLARMEPNVIWTVGNISERIILFARNTSYNSGGRRMRLHCELNRALGLPLEDHIDFRNLRPLILRNSYNPKNYTWHYSTKPKNASAI
jgi:hypothetical protein